MSRWTDGSARVLASEAWHHRLVKRSDLEVVSSKDLGGEHVGEEQLCIVQRF
jgi:hypothetical protein